MAITKRIVKIAVLNCLRLIFPLKSKNPLNIGSINNPFKEYDPSKFETVYAVGLELLTEGV